MPWLEFPPLPAILLLNVLCLRKGPLQLVSVLARFNLSLRSLLPGKFLFLFMYPFPTTPALILILTVPSKNSNFSFACLPYDFVVLLLFAIFSNFFSALKFFSFRSHPTLDCISRMVGSTASIGGTGRPCYVASVI